MHLSTLAQQSIEHSHTQLKQGEHSLNKSLSPPPVLQERDPAYVD